MADNKTTHCDPLGSKPVGAITITESPIVPAGRQVLTRPGKPVYIGAIGDPIEDAEFDGVVLNPTDFAQLRKATS